VKEVEWVKFEHHSRGCLLLLWGVRKWCSELVRMRDFGIHSSSHRGPASPSLKPPPTPHRPFFCHHGSHTVCVNSKFSNLITSSWTWDWGVGLQFDWICHPIRLSTYLVGSGLIHIPREILWAKMKVYYRLSGLFCLHGSNAIGQEFPSYITHFVAFCHFFNLPNTFCTFLLTG
jgi:hypothetical protein